MVHPTNNKSIPEKIIWHLIVLTGALVISVFFSVVLQQQVRGHLFQMLLLTFVQLEIFIWLGTMFFQSLEAGSKDFKKKMITRLILFYLVVLIIAVIFYLLLFTYYFVQSGTSFSFYFSSLFSGEMKGFLRAILVGFTLGSLLFFYFQWNDALKREQKLTEEKLIFQYETLKRQINPHFLFNSLNTLSSLVRSDVELSENFIQKLSSVYRYVLENMDSNLVQVSTELKFVEDYFYLQKIRDQEKINLNIELNNQEEGLIPPVSLQMLVENALKHNVSSRNNPLTVTIHYEGLDKVVVRNNLHKKTQLNQSSGIGLKNLNERCRLILNSEIEIQQNNDEFVVKLPIKIN